MKRFENRTFKGHDNIVNNRIDEIEEHLHLLECLIDVNLEEFVNFIIDNQ